MNPVFMGSTKWTKCPPTSGADPSAAFLLEVLDPETELHVHWIIYLDVEYGP